MRGKKLRQNFQGYLDSFCSCGWHIETTIHCFHNDKTKFHCFPYCSDYSDQIKTLFEKVTKNIRNSLLNEIYAAVVGTFLFVLSYLNVEDNALIIESTIEDIITMKRFIATLLWIYLSKLPLFLKTLIDSGSLYVTLSSCLVVKSFIYLFILYTLLRAYHQTYVVCDLFSLIFFISLSLMLYS